MSYESHTDVARFKELAKQLFVHTSYTANSMTVHAKLDAPMNQSKRLFDGTALSLFVAECRLEDTLFFL